MTAFDNENFYIANIYFLLYFYKKSGMIIQGILFGILSFIVQAVLFIAMLALIYLVIGSVISAFRDDSYDTNTGIDIIDKMFKR